MNIVTQSVINYLTYDLLTAAPNSSQNSTQVVLKSGHLLWKEVLLTQLASSKITLNIPKDISVVKWLARWTFRSLVIHTCGPVLKLSYTQ